MADYNTITDVSVKYLKDENGNIISPVTSGESVFLPNDDKMLQDKVDNIDDSILTINDKLINATTSTAGFMSAEDKTKLDGITENADSVSVTQTLTSGTKIGTVTVNGTGTDLYAPVPGITYSSFVVQSHGLSVSYKAYNSGNNTATLTKSGYYPLGIVSGTYNYTQTGFTISPTRIYNRANGSCTIAYWGKNDSNGATNNCTGYVDVLWVKI